MKDANPVLILGAGINGAALAREFLLNGIPVCLVDNGDIGSGATAASSRLIHGGLRYLEYGEFDLVRESLEERTRLLRLAPHLVRPLRIFIPVTNRFGGVLVAARRFFHLEGNRRAIDRPARGLWLVRMGLKVYDTYARDPMLPRHAVHRVGDRGVPCVERSRYVALCSYYDAQLCYPERFVIELLEDARRIAQAGGIEFSVSTYHCAERRGKRVSIKPIESALGSATGEVKGIEPIAIVNATGAWVDRTLNRLGVSAGPLMGGTKGSHLVTYHRGLHAALAGQALYAEARDGRPIFVLPFGDATLIGTTDIPFEGDPRDATADEEEVEYLIDAVNAVVGGVEIARADIALHYSGVRPLPRAEGKTASSITRRHWLESHEGVDVPFYSVIGGKLTTCRSLAEEGVAKVLDRLSTPVVANSRERPMPGGVEYPPSADEVAQRVGEFADRLSLSREQVAEAWQWFGTRAEEVLEAIAPTAEDCVAGTRIPRELVRWMIDHEWVSELGDLVERRLLLLFREDLSAETLRDLAALLVEAEKLEQDQVAEQVGRMVRRLTRRYGRQVDGNEE